MNVPVAVLLMAYGSPSSMDEVESYYTQIRGGGGVSSSEVERLKARYLAIGGRSPLLEITLNQARALEEELNRGGGEFRVYVGMRHSHPFLKEALQQVLRDGLTTIVALPLSPYYSKMSTGGYEEALAKAQTELGVKLSVRFVKSWHDNPYLIAAWVERIAPALKDAPALGTTLLFTAHSLPVEILKWNDPYPRMLLETCGLIAAALRFESWTFCYQSAGSKGREWVGPDLRTKLSELHALGCRRVVVAPVGFVADNLEVLYDIDIEAKNLARSYGIELLRVPSLDVNPLFVMALTSVVRRILGMGYSAIPAP